MSSDKVFVIGSGPAGMGCAYTLTESGQPCLVIEQENEPGGLCRTLDFHGCLFDIGGHRFLTKSAEIKKLWHNKAIGVTMHRVQRQSRIFYRGRYFNYPLTFLNTLLHLGLLENFACVMSYIKYKYFKKVDERTFDGWIINHFGKKLYDIFFKNYTEKVWGISCQNISADWAKQRIRGLSLRVAIEKAFSRMKKNTPKTLNTEFYYPRTGPGEFYKKFYEVISKQKGNFLFRRTVRSVKHDGKKIVAIEFSHSRNGTNEELPVDYLFSSIPLPSFIESLHPRPPEEVLNCSQKLSFRGFLVVNIILEKENLFPDQWIYVHSPDVKLGRIQNYKNWSPAMVVDPKKTSLGLEYFCNEGDDFWNMNDVDLIEYALEELHKIGISVRKHHINGFVVRCPHAYPVYTLDYQKNLCTIQNYLKRFSNLQMIGRGGLFRYNNSDHSLLTGIYAARNYLGKGSYDIRLVNADQEYLES